MVAPFGRDEFVMGQGQRERGEKSNTWKREGKP
jgi:hypothetical protein